MTRTGTALASLLAAGLLLGGCGAQETRILPPVADVVETAVPEFDGSLEPAAAVLALVPQDVAVVTVTDFDQVRLQMGLQDLTTADRRRDRDAFWARAAAERPMLTRGLLRDLEPGIVRRHGVSQVDVSWEARLLDADRQEVGYVLAFRDGTDMDAVAAAVDEAGLEGADVDAERGLLTRGIADDNEESWAADPEARAMVGLPANATYLARGCAEPRSRFELPASTRVDDLDLWSVQLEGSLVTARLGEARSDLFDRMRAGSAMARFAEVFDGGVADPRTGRIGYVMTDPAAAATMVLDQDLPFAACG